MSAKSLKPRISVLVLTRNRLDVLRQCINSILCQRYQEYEIVILDDASDGGDTAHTIVHEIADSRIRPYHTTTSLGVAGGRNFLMEKARGEFLVSIDDDAVFVADNALDEVRQAFEREPTVGVVAFSIMNIVNGKETPLVPFSQLVVTRTPEVLSRRAFVSSFRGGGHAIRKCLIDDHGGYRSNMIFGEEEMDLAYRVIQAGHRIVYEPSIDVNHFPMPSVVCRTKSHRSSELYYHIRNRAYLAYRYLPWKYAYPYLGIWLLRYGVRSLLNDGLTSFVRGTLATPHFLRGVKRQVLDRKAIIYLEQHGGRLWY